MYSYQRPMFAKEGVYIAGPECFYTNGYDLLAAMRKKAEYHGFKVTLPNDDPLDLQNPDLQKRADSIFANLKKVMNETTVIMADLEAFRGAEADGGTVFEIGMAYAKGARCYGYTRDKRTLAAKNQGSKLRDGIVYDEKGNVMPYHNLPFSPAVVGSTKIIEGDFDDCLQLLMVDLEEEYKARRYRKRVQVLEEAAPVKRERPLIYLSTVDRYLPDADAIYAKSKEICSSYGFDAVSPLDWAPGVEQVYTDNPYIRAANLVDNYHQHVKNCDIVIGDLNNFRGYEPSNDVSFECGMGFQLGKKLYGYMDDARPMLERVPHFGPDREYRDQAGCNVENFNYPLNLMFACCMEIVEGAFEDVIKKVADDFRA